MALFDFLKNKKQTSLSQYSEIHNRLIDKLLTQVNAIKDNNYSVPSFTRIQVYNDLKSQDDQFIKSLILVCIERLNTIKQTKGYQNYYGSNEHFNAQVITTLISLLIRRKIEYKDDELLELTIALTKNLDKNSFDSGIPFKPVLTKIEVNIQKNGINKSLKSALKELIINGKYQQDYAEFRTINERIEYLLNGSPEISIDVSDVLGKEMAKFLVTIQKQKESDVFRDLINHFIQTEGKSIPSDKWLKEFRIFLNALGKDVLVTIFQDWLNICIGKLEYIHKTDSDNVFYLSEVNHTFIKSLIWASSQINDPDLNNTIDNYGLIAFKKFPGHGSLSVRTGNACLYCFSILPFKDGISRLTKFKMKIKYPSVHKQIEKYIDIVAKKEGYSKDQLEELAVPDFGIVDNCLVKSIEEYQAIIELKDVNEVLIKWESGGKTQVSIPSKIKTDHKEELNSVKKLVKEIQILLPVQKDRIEQFYKKDRTWKYTDWVASYIEHPLTSVIAKKLIWSFKNATNQAEGIFLEGNIVDVNNQTIDWLNDEVMVQLWHPINCSPENVLNWRTFLNEHEIIQPFKQAYREIYLVTPAELNTHSYSNRFAAHILRQHQFTALCKQRGWQYTLMGTWDSHNTPEIQIPHWDMKAEFYVDSDWDDANANEAGIFNYICTDQVRFYKGTELMNMVDIPPIVFSEIMRDVDLFVGVTSIGNDVAWQDSGNNQMDTYWRNYSFGDLTESSKIREEVLKRVVPKLKIASQCSFDGKYLIVKGKLKTYKIHLGSGNILMSPNDQYLCIVASRNSKGKETIFLPFEGDAILSIIISKAQLLAEDDKIKDPTILSQLNK